MCGQISAKIEIFVEATKCPHKTSCYVYISDCSRLASSRDI